MLAGTWSLEDFSHRLDEFDELAEGFRRWAFESAVLDLALRQNELGLGQALGRPELPVRFVVSTRADARELARVRAGLEFKLDAEKDWDRRLLRRLRELDRVRVVDLKAYYRGTGVDLAPSPGAVPRDRRGAARGRDRGRLAGGRPASRRSPAPRIASASTRPFTRWPISTACRSSRVAQHQAVALRHGARSARDDRGREEREIKMYGGGQYELGPGRLQIQRLASVFYPEGPNDVAPSAYNEGEPREGLPQSPLPPKAAPGF